MSRLRFPTFAPPARAGETDPRGPDRFYAEVTAVKTPSSGKYTAKEMWLDGTGALVEKAAGRIIGSENYGVPLDADWAFAVGDLVDARPGDGAGGLIFSLVPLPAAFPEPDPAHLASITEATGAASGTGRRPNASTGAWEASGVTYTDTLYVMEVGGSAFTLSPSATVLILDLNGKHVAVPFQYAGRVSGVDYGGLIAPGSQQIPGPKTFLSDVGVTGQVSAASAAVTGAITGDSLGITADIAAGGDLSAGGDASIDGELFVGTHATDGKITAERSGVTAGALGETIAGGFDRQWLTTGYANGIQVGGSGADVFGGAASGTNKIANIGMVDRTAYNAWHVWDAGNTWGGAYHTLVFDTCDLSVYNGAVHAGGGFWVGTGQSPSADNPLVGGKGQTGTLGDGSKVCGGIVTAIGSVASLGNWGSF